jgi:hypothetical protein
MTNPTWWNSKHEGTWDRVKSAMRADWEQTKNDLSKKHGEELHQNAKDTVKQMAGKEAIPATPKNWDDIEPGYRFGAGAREQYGAEHTAWDSKLEGKLAKDWDSLKTGHAWDHVKGAVRRAWDSVKH